MAENVQDATFEVLKRIQEGLSSLRGEMEQRFDRQRAEFDERFARLETEARKDRRNINGLMALLQAASGDFDERIRDIDDRVSILEDRAS